MRGLVGLLTLLLLSTTIYAEELQKVEIEKCTYLAGVAREVQIVRQTGVTYNQFVKETSRIYKRDEGYLIILAIADRVYAVVGVDIEPSRVFESLFDFCIQPNIPKAEIEYLI